MGQNDLSASISNTISSLWEVLNTSIRRLSSGLRITSARDDASGLAVRELLRADVALARQGSRNVSDAASMIQIADAAAQTIGDNLIRMKELAAQASSGTLNEQQKELIQREFDQLASENTRIMETTEYNGKKLFAEGQKITVSVGFGNVVELHTQAVSQAAADLVNGADDASESVDKAIDQLSALRGSFGSMINQLDSASQTLNERAESILAAQSRISDVNVAQEIAAMAAAEVQSKTAIASQTQANLMNEVVYSLVK